jgi:superoxide dismutase, Cu-Zn family
MRRLLLAAVVAALSVGALALTSAVGANDRDGRKRAWALLQDTGGEKVGLVTFSERHGEVTVRGFVRGLSPGFHGFHVHAVGECTPPFTSAGGHFNPGGAGHGDHAGDMPSLLVNEDGSAALEFPTDRFSVADLFDADGSAVIVHANRDNFANIPDRYHSHTEDTFGPDSATLATGDAGGRTACGVVDRRHGD